MGVEMENVYKWTTCTFCHLSRQLLDIWHSFYICCRCATSPNYNHRRTILFDCIITDCLTVSVMTSVCHLTVLLFDLASWVFSSTLTRIFLYLFTFSFLPAPTFIPSGPGYSIGYCLYRRITRGQPWLSAPWIRWHGYLTYACQRDAWCIFSPWRR